jgi:hypothetical protein
MVNSVIWLLIGLLIGKFIGWNSAHHTIAQECRKLGGFFVGKSVFKCTELKDPEPFIQRKIENANGK